MSLISAKLRVFFVMGILASLTYAPAARQSAESETLSAGKVVAKTLKPGEGHSYSAALTPGTWHIAVEQRGIDLAVEIQDPSGAPVLRSDSPLDRYGPETALFQAGSPGIYRIDIAAALSQAPEGKYEILLRKLNNSTTQQLNDPENSATRQLNNSARRRAEALRAMSRGGEHYAEGNPAARQKAIAEYLSAAKLWGESKKTRFQATALYAAGVLYRLTNQDAEASRLDQQVLPLWRDLNDRGRQADTLNEMGLLAWHAGKTDQARDFFQQAFDIQQGLEDRFGQAAALNNVCLMSLVEGKLLQGLECYEPALDVFRQLGDRETEVAALTNLGRVHDLLGHPEEALKSYGSALALNASLGNRKREAQTLNNLAVLHRNLGEIDEALKLYERALDVFRQEHDERWEARVLYNIGFAYHWLGDPPRSLSYLRQSLTLRRKVGDRGGEAATLRGIGVVHDSQNEPDKALEFFQQALSRFQDLGDSHGQASALAWIGFAENRLGRREAAIERYDQALGLLAADPGTRQQAGLLLWKGQALAALHRSQEAEASLSQALTLYSALGDPDGTAAAQTSLAQVLLLSGEERQALGQLDQAIDSFEATRTRVADPDLRASYLSARRDAYELKIDLLMRRHKREPDKGYDRAALETSERARARSLLEMLDDLGPRAPSSVSGPLRTEWLSARRELHAKARLRQEILERKHSPEEAEDAEHSVYLALSRLERAENAVRLSSGVPPETPSALTAPGIQGLLDADTRLLEYALGEERSYLWVVEPAQVHSFELAPRAQIEDAVRQLHDSLSSPSSGSPAHSPGLSIGLLPQPARDLVRNHRLVIVPDGALHYLPFASLEDPSSATGEPLPAHHELVQLPSATALALQRSRGKERPRAPRLALVVADPVFAADDLRISGKAPAASSQDGTRGASASDFYRLSSSRREADAIFALGGPEQIRVVSDFQATRSWLLEAPLRDYRILHFATHGVIDSQNPALSSLVLSLRDEQGRPLDGFLRLHDIYNLDLNADLVVLSACSTALGREVRGEGMVGLTRGFMNAGAQRVVASLWPVRDRAAAEFMSVFYRDMIREGKAPAAALRNAQLELASQRRWRDPHYWAGFFLTGDWK